ncbi:MAG TPA: mannonate dehydratase, partial [Bryobacteraceae bacterium]
MNRRTFTKFAAAPFALLQLPAIDGARKPPPQAGSGKIKLGNQNWSDDASLKVLAALGVNHICSAEPSRAFDENWSVEGLSRLRERVESRGITLAAVPLPLSSSYITKAENPNIMLGKSPERDREIDN